MKVRETFAGANQKSLMKQSPIGLTKKGRKSMKQVYKRGNYAKLELFWRGEKKGIVTRSEMIAFGQSIGMSEKEAAASATVILSPRETSERGDCRGNLSAQGQAYFAEPLAKETGEEKRFRFRVRDPELERRTRDGKAPKAKTVKAKAKAKAGKKTQKARKSKTVKTVEATAAPAPAVEPAAPAVVDQPAPAAAVETPATAETTDTTPAS